MTPYKGHHREKILTMEGTPLGKDPFYPRKVTEPQGTKLHYEGLENSEDME